MPSYYVPKSFGYNSGSCEGSDGVTLQKVKGVRSSTQSSIIKTKNIHAFYQSLTPTAVEVKGQGNTMKKGSGGNSYSDYMARKKGNLSQYCGC